VKIEIYHQTYNVHAEENEEYLKELAAYVDAKMRTVAEATQTVDTVRIAVLAALNIADELHSQEPGAARAASADTSKARAEAAGRAEAIREASEEARTQGVREATDRMRVEREEERRRQMEKNASVRRQLEECAALVDKAIASAGNAAA